jgi:hypothetical protein
LPGPLPEKEVVRVLHFYDTEFGYGAKDHTNVLKQRLSIGVVSWVEFEDGTRQEILAKFEMIINDWKEHLHRTPMRLERTQSWYTSISSAPCNADVARAPEKEVVENFVAYLRAALLFFPGVEHVLAGHCSNTVDLPALNPFASAIFLGGTWWW